MPESESLWGILYDLGALRCSCRQPEGRNLDLRDEGQGAAAGTGKEAAPCGSNEGLECLMGSCVLSAVLHFPGVSGRGCERAGSWAPILLLDPSKTGRMGPWRRVELQIVSSKVSDQALRHNRWIDR